VKLGVLGRGRSLTDSDRWAGGGDARSPNGDVDRNSISVVCHRVSQEPGSRHTDTTQQYLDRTDNADRR